MPSWPIEMPSDTEIVPNSSGYPPAAWTPSLTALASRSRGRLQGVISFQLLATPICGLAKSSSPMPTARSIPRAAAFSRPSVTSRLLGFMSGPEGMAFSMPSAFREAKPVIDTPTGYPGRMPPMIRLLVALAAALLLTSCSNSTSESSADNPKTDEPVITGQPAGFNADDVAFATNMIPHHQQAVDLSALVPDRTTNGRLVELAKQISA